MGNEKNNNFNEFKNIFPLSKTRRFSLIPVLSVEQEKQVCIEKEYSSKDEITRQDRVEKFFKDNNQNVFNVDIERKKRYRALKYYLTELHKLFIKDSLEVIKGNSDINFSELFELYKEYETSNNEEKGKIIGKINNEKVRLAKYFGDKEGKGGVFQEIAKKYYEYLKNNLKNKEKIKGGDDKQKFANGLKNILISQNVLMILGKKINDGSIKEKPDKNPNKENEYAINFKVKEGDEKETNLIEYFDGWSTYFKNFNEIRGNLYKDEGRKQDSEGDDEKEEKLVKANSGQLTTRILDENFEIFVKNATLAEKNRVILGLVDYQNKNVVANRSIFDPDYYVNCLLQIDINSYNAAISELNKLFNEKKGKKKIDYLNPLYKQLLLSDGLEEFEDGYINEFNNDFDLIEGLEKFYKQSIEKLSIIGNFLENGQFNGDLDSILLKENQTHYYCNIFFGSWSYIRDLYYEQNGIGIKNRSDKKGELKDKNGQVKTEISLAEIKFILDGISKGKFQEDIKIAIDNAKQRSRSVFDLLGIDDGEKIYKEDKSNFENFILFLKFYFDSLLNGRSLLTEREKKDKEKITQTKLFLQKSKTEGERVDELLMDKFSEESYLANIKASINKKQEEFENAFKNLKQSINLKKGLSRKEDFRCKQAINDYCVRISDINGFFALFSIPEGIVADGDNRIIQKFKDKNGINALFGVIRNYITKKDATIEEIKLNFDNQILLDGWDINKETERLCFIFIDEEDENDKKYYLGILDNGKDKNLLERKYHNEFFVEKSTFKKMDYKFFKDAAMMIPKCSTQLGIVKNHFINLNNDKFVAERGKTLKKDSKIIKPLTINRRIFELNNFEYKKEYLKTLKQDSKELDTSRRVVADSKKSDQIKLFQKDFFELTGDDLRYRSALRDWIDFCKEFLKSYESTQIFKFDFKKTEEYNSIDEFYRDVDINTYNITLTCVDKSYLQKEIERRNIFLFQIYGKDFSPKRGSIVKNPTKDINTLQFEALFAKENIGSKDVKGLPLFKLSGQAEIFFHPQKESYNVERWSRDDLKNPKTDKIPYKKRRYAENQIIFHVPIVVNNISNGGNVDKKIHNYIQQRNDVKILGIDRGEKELAYCCLLDGEGAICGDVKSMNIVGSNIKNGIRQPINYQKKLDIKEKERLMARRSWTKIEGIKDIKRGYDANLIHEITTLMFQENALVCLEELNHGFKKDRTRIEKSIYQQFENDLVSKLNYLVLEKTPEGIRNALQLTPPNRAQKTWGNQMGSIFYTDARYTSKTCPNCGFRHRSVGGLKTSQEIKNKIAAKELKMFYDKKSDRFRIEYHWNYEFKQNGKQYEFGSKDLYNGEMEYIFSDVNRSYWNNNDLKNIFKDYLVENEDLFSLIKGEPKFRYVDFGKVFISLTWLRHSVKEGDQEYDEISCPKCHFWTRSPKVKKIKDGDANGAYNIARKGLIILDKIRSEKLKNKMNTKDGIKSKDLKLSLKEWDESTYSQWDKKDWIESDNKRGL